MLRNTVGCRASVYHRAQGAKSDLESGMSASRVFATGSALEGVPYSRVSLSDEGQLWAGRAMTTEAFARHAARKCGADPGRSAGVFGDPQIALHQPYITAP